MEKFGARLLSGPGLKACGSRCDGKALIVWLTATGPAFTHLMAEVLLPTGLTGRGLITGNSAWLLTRAPFWITPRGTKRQEEQQT